MSSFLTSLISTLTSSGSQQSPPAIYLQSNGDQIQFPVGPAEFGVNVKQNNSVININNLGELNMIGKTGLKALTFSSFFPLQSYNFCACTPSDPKVYINTIEKWRTSGLPSRFIINGTPINYPVTIDSFSWTIKDGTGDVYFTLELKEYVFVGNAKDTTQVNSKTGLKKRTDLASNGQSALSSLVYPGDSIMNVIGRTVGKYATLGDATGINNTLSAYKSIVKGGGVSTGNLVSYAANSGIIKVGGKIV